MSEIQISPFSNVQGRAREAMEFYHNVLGGQLDLQISNPQGVSRPAGARDRISYARLASAGAVIFASDGHPDYPARVGDNVAIALSGSDKNRLLKMFDGLAAGGQVKMPPTKQPGGSQIGWLTDRFGTSWTINIEAAK